MVVISSLFQILILNACFCRKGIFVAFRELLAALRAFQLFSKLSPTNFIRINSDNTSVVAWLNKGRCSKPLEFLLPSATEFYKYKFALKVKAFHLKSIHNTSAEALSRSLILSWLKLRGKK